MDTIKKYFIYMNRSHKNLEELFIVTELPVASQTPIIMSEDKEEVEGICLRFNATLKSQIEELALEKDISFFLRK